MTFLTRHNKGRIANWWWTVDKINFSLAMFLIFVGIMLVLSASPSAAHRDRLVDEFSFVKKQGVFICMGIVLMIGISMQSMRTIRRLAILGFLGAFAGVVLTYFVGDAAKGAQRWIKFAGFSLQPSEFVKPTFIVVTAWLLDAKKRTDDFPGMEVATCLFVVTACSVFLQPDLGMTLLITGVWVCQMLWAGIPFWLFGCFGLVGVLLIGGAYLFLAHVKDRIDRFLATENEIGSQIQKSMDAFANGNLMGRGPGEGVIKMSLPDVHTDFIFSLAGEEYGVWLTTIIVISFGVIVVRTMLTSMKDNNLFQMYAASGLAASLGGQAIVNMCSSLKLIPAKGMTLPFVSYGGSSMLASCICMGMLLALTRKNAVAEDKDNG
ncbi:MAG: cell division protein FtsW [Alphaproteobacteria bacterium]|nr:cell division protein FtsW [Alphaproteobacteria bacterium]